MRSVLLAVIVLASLPAAAQTMEPGEWEFRTVMTTSMSPGPQASTTVRCVTPEDARDPTRFTARNEAANCTVTPGARTANSYEWTVQCAEGMRGSGKARFSGGTVQSQIHMSADMQGMKMEVDASTEGRRLGPCK